MILRKYFAGALVAATCFVSASASALGLYYTTSTPSKDATRGLFKLSGSGQEGPLTAGLATAGTTGESFSLEALTLCYGDPPPWTNLDYELKIYTDSSMGTELYDFKISQEPFTLNQNQKTYLAIPGVTLVQNGPSGYGQATLVIPQVTLLYPPQVAGDKATGEIDGTLSLSYAPNPVPEPFTMALGAAGLGLALARRRARKS